MNPDQSYPLTAPVFTASEGKVFRRGIYQHEPSKLLAVFMDSAESGDRYAAELADELRDAISVAEDYYNPIEERNAA